MKVEKEENSSERSDSEKLFPGLLSFDDNAVDSKKKHAKKKRRKSRKKPYAAKNFLCRPKINAPANTTQFLCDDKEYYLNVYPTATLTSSSESDSMQSSSSSSANSSETSSEVCPDNAVYDSVFTDANHDFSVQEFERMYDDIRVELLCNKTTEELTSQCLELETTVHNLQYLLQREISKRQRLQQICCLIQANEKLTQENEGLRGSNSSFAQLQM